MASDAFPIPHGWQPRARASREQPSRSGLRKAAPIDGAGGNEIESIGINKPLTLEIVYVSTGETAPGWWHDDLLVTSAVKKLPVYSGAPRAVNAVVPNLPDRLNQRFDTLAATLNATPVIYHSPAQTERGVVVTIEMVWNKFDNELVQQIGGFLGSAAGIPLFAPASAYLLAGSILVKAIGNLFERVVDGQAAFTDTLTLSLNRPGLADTPASFHVLYGNSVAIDKLIRDKAVDFDPDRGLLEKATGNPAPVSDPYVVVLAYGNERPDYAGFTPTMATAAMLEKFFHQGQADRPIGGEVLDLLKATNNISYRSRALDLAGRARALDKGAANYAAKIAEIRAEFDASNKNIADESLRIPWPLS